jgi:hypothetical protein
MEIGALQYLLLTGRQDLVEPTRAELETLVALVTADGRVEVLPSKSGNIIQEYGFALSTLGLGARAFRTIDAEFARRCLVAGSQVFDYAARRFEPASSEDCAILLTGFCDVYRVMKDF